MIRWFINGVFGASGKPGTALKRLLSLMRFRESPDCQCEIRADLMDAMGPDWCAENRETIVGWLIEELCERIIRWTKPWTQRLVSVAIRLSRG
jgi:hypothetical protein